MGEEHGLQVDESLRFTKRLWQVQRWAIPLLLLLLVLALLGAFGYGWLGHGQSGKRGEPLWLTYDRLAQVQTPTIITAHVTDVSGEQLELWLEEGFLEAAQIERIQPEPSESIFDQGRIIYRFPAQPGTREAAVHLHYTPIKAGTTNMRIGIVGGDERAFSVFVYP